MANKILRTLYRLSLLTPNIRQALCKIAENNQQNSSSPFEGIDASFQRLETLGYLNADNAEAIIMHNGFSTTYYSKSQNLIELIKLNISTPENRRLAVRIEDYNYIIPKFLKFLDTKNIKLNHATCVELEEIIEIQRQNLSNDIYLLKKSLSEFETPTLLDFKNILQKTLLTKVLDCLPFTLRNEANKQFIKLHYKDNSMIYFFNFLAYEKIFTQENFNKLMFYSSYLKIGINDLHYINKPDISKKNFKEIIKKINSSIAFESITLKQGFRSHDSNFYKLPDDLFPLISRFLIQFPDKKINHLFTHKVDSFHSNWIKENKKGPKI